MKILLKLSVLGLTLTSTAGCGALQNLSGLHAADAGETRFTAATIDPTLSTSMPSSGYVAAGTYGPPGGYAPPPIQAPYPPPEATRRRTAAPQTDQTAIIKTAMEKATAPIRPDGFVESVHLYDYIPGMTYPVVTSPGHITSIALRPGEKLNDFTAGDTARWLIGSTTIGAAPAVQTLVIIKPLREGLDTNLLIATDERAYFLHLTSIQDTVYLPGIAWNYPQLEWAQRARTQGVTTHPSTSGDFVDPTRLNTAYTIRTTHGNDPAWRPLRAFDDGSKTWIEFPPNLGSLDAPPLFVLNSDGNLAQVNYNIRGRYYVVDRLFAAAELRLGETDQVVVRITNGHPPTSTGLASLP